MVATRPPSWFPSIKRQPPGSIHPIFLWHIGGDYRKVPFDDQLRRSCKMATTATILNLVSLDFLTNGWFDWSDCLVAHWGWLEESSFRWSAPPLIQWPLCPPSWIWFPLIFSPTPGSTGPIFWWLIGVINLLPKPYLPYTHRQLPTLGHMPRLALPLSQLHTCNLGYTLVSEWGQPSQNSSNVLCQYVITLNFTFTAKFCRHQDKLIQIPIILWSVISLQLWRGKKTTCDFFLHVQSQITCFYSWLRMGWHF
jgi:hypothetical protein